jgi:hypothetical protein
VSFMQASAACGVFSGGGLVTIVALRQYLLSATAAFVARTCCLLYRRVALCQPLRSADAFEWVPRLAEYNSAMQQAMEQIESPRDDKQLPVTTRPCSAGPTADLSIENSNYAWQRA